VKIAFAILLFAAVFAHAQEDGNFLGSGKGAFPMASTTYNTSVNWTPKDPWRVVDGKIYSAVDDGWVQFSGKVLEVQQGKGIRVLGKYSSYIVGHPSSDDDDAKEFFVANFPYDIADDSEIGHQTVYMAKNTNRTYTYPTVSGGSHTIDMLDYGVPCDEPEAVKEDREQKSIAAQAALEAARIAEAQKQFLVQSNVIVWLKPQATNGDASAQCDLGEHYLNGQGCETNKTLAIFWLQKAAAQGYSEASNRLAKINLVSTNTIPAGAP
jgi:hypothetical protein